MQHLWIDVELSPSHADSRPPWPFRFQKRVSLARSARRWGLPAPTEPDPLDVGHFGVRPDYPQLAATPLAELPAYVIGLVHRDAVILEARRRRLGGFDAVAFRNDIARYLKTLADGRR